MDERVSVAEAAVRLGVSTDAIRKRLSRGTLEGDKVDGVWYVHIDTPSGAPDSGQSVVSGQVADSNAPVSGHPVDTGALASLIADLAAENARLAAAAGMWQERSRHIDEENQNLKKQLLALNPGPVQTDEATGSPQSDESTTTAISTHVETPSASASILQRVWHAITGRE